MSGKVALAKAQMDTAKNIYADNLPTEFIASYIDCLKKAGFTSEATAYQQKLDLIRKRDLEACVACGRG
jgi:predicted transcriptional regulator